MFIATCTLLLTALTGCGQAPAPPSSVRVLAPSRASSVEAPAPAHGYGWPLRPQPTVAKPFDAPPEPWAAGHRGVDLRGVAGQQVHAAGSGRVAYSGVIAGRGVLSIEHANGWRTTYEPLESRLQMGAVVEAGDPIGRLATTASHCAPQACLHWGLLLSPDHYADPLMLVRIRPVILLPLS